MRKSTLSSVASWTVIASTADKVIMHYTICSPGRSFVLRLEDGDVLHEAVEAFAIEQGITAASVMAVGGADDGSTLVVGPNDGNESPIRPMKHVLAGVHEFIGVGTIFIDETGKPTLHMHASCGREGKAVTGCVHAGVSVWLVMELVIHELLGCDATRLHDPISDFDLLHIK
ncbi:MAG: hypothetical protein PWQ88_335 [Candidatus Methanomethylophilaceae archaeon]|nr:hypothetical protein [Candidatus Methanomethylophilaceae archaeon]MDI3542294.1 hypothetical protein [Candidatus Methanomethylophilaceae archaeon]